MSDFYFHKKFKNSNFIKQKRHIFLNNMFEMGNLFVVQNEIKYTIPAHNVFEWWEARVE